jgi:hypothetical protein
VTWQAEQRGQPYQRVDAKRTFDNVEVSFDWHDYLANKWSAGVAVSINSCIRRNRELSNGQQLRALNDGVTGHRPIPWPRVAGISVPDGSVTWISEEISSASLRTAIADSVFPDVDDLVLSAEANTDLVYRVVVDGGVSGRSYEIRHQVTFANGEEKEAVAVLPVRD